MWTWSRISRISWSWGWSKRRCVSCKTVVISWIRAWYISVTRVMSVKGSVRSSVGRAIGLRISFVIVISWSNVLWRSSTLVVTESISRCRAISVLWTNFVSIISWITSTSIACIVSFCSVVWWRTKVFVLVISLFFETSRDAVICSMTVGAIFFICRLSFVIWVSRLCKHKLFLLLRIKSLCL